MRAGIQTLGLILFGTAVGLLLAEGVSRALYTRPWYVRLVDAQTANAQAQSIHVNKRGLRDREYDAQKPPNTTRILLLGDSFSFGSGVADDDAIFPERVEKDLDHRFATRGRRLELLNGGIPGSLTRDWVDLLNGVKDTFHPDVVVIVFFLRDGTSTGSIGGFFKPIRREIASRNEASALYRHSSLFRLYQDQRDRQEIATRYSAAINDAYLGRPKQTQEWHNAKGNILEIKEAAEAMGAKVLLVVFPILVELDEHYPFAAVCDQVVDFGRHHGIPTLDLRPAFMGRNGPDLWVSSFDQHPNAEGHAIAARSIADFVWPFL